MTNPPVLRIEKLQMHLSTRQGTIRAVDDVSWHAAQGEVLGIVGESGCGKSLMALSVMRLLPRSTGRIVEGSIFFHSTDLVRLSEKEMREIRGNRISMIFQEPMTSLNPVLTVGQQIAEAIVLHQGLSRSVAWRRAVEMLERVQVPDAHRRAGEYPFQLSGGMRQRAMIAMALACEPEVLIADEPTTALDVTIQAQILRLLDDMRRELGTTIILITHDLGVVAEICDRVLVMYAGRIVESADIDSLFSKPAHPYTRGLMRARPHRQGNKTRLAEIPGTVPSLREKITGCSFAPRCELAVEHCRLHAPALSQDAGNRSVACWLADKGC